MKSKIAVVAVVVCAWSLLGFADTLIMKDSTRHAGTFISATAKTVTFKEGTRIHRYPVSTVQTLEFGHTTATGATEGTSGEPTLAQRPKSSAAAATRTGRETVVIPSGTEVSVRTNQDIDSGSASVGQKFEGMVANDVSGSSGEVEIPKGSNAELVIREVNAGGITKAPEMALDLSSVEVHGKRYLVNTSTIQQQGTGNLGANKRTAEMVGGGAVLGTLIGAIAGGGKGAAIGAAAGGATGAGAQVLTRGKEVKVPAETILQFKLTQPLRLEAAR
jgi:hypothetical protein